MKRLVIGILAHVDAGKTTLAESLLYRSGSIRKLGRVDHKDAFLDTYELERARGITIFSKQAEFKYKELEVSLLDTPGHVDFSAEMERTLQVLDYAILVISGSAGIQGHTETLWKLLTRYQIPTFIFVNKMDMEGTDSDCLLHDIKLRLHDGAMNFNQDPKSDEFMESIAVCDEKLLETYLESGVVTIEDVQSLMNQRKVFPCFFGSALRLEGVDEFLEGLSRYVCIKKYPMEFGAKVYKIARDDQGNRLTYMKVTGGSLKVKMALSNEDSQTVQGDIWTEKVNQIRIYSGTRYETVDEIMAGSVCAVTGLAKTYAGEGLGIESISEMPLLMPVLNYQILLSEGIEPHGVLGKLRQLEEEDPTLHIIWHEQLKEIHVQLMGEVQIDILKTMLKERFSLEVEFGPGNIMYKETIEEVVEGVGHFEPLRHYAEVHLLMEPGEEGSGISVDTKCSLDDLEVNWQQAVLNHIYEKEHLGVLTGSPITDIKITLVDGKAHLKHTEGGDFREATYRAIRNGLKRTKSVLLEPYYNFRIEVPSEAIGRAMTDIQRMNGTFSSPRMEEDFSILEGFAPVSTMQGYQVEVIAYTRGKGRIFCSLKGYLPCHNQEEVIEQLAYDSERDLGNPTGSVFCSHGAGFVVTWDQVEHYMHIPYRYTKVEKTKIINEGPVVSPVRREASINDQELEDIFVRTFGPIKRRLPQSSGSLGYEKKSSIIRSSQTPEVVIVEPKETKEYLLVDGYNIIFSWASLSDLAKENMDGARSKLMDILCNYQGFTNKEVILVFDAYKVKGGVGNISTYHNINVVYTKEAETADQYIEKVTHEMARKYHVTVATSDALEQMIIFGKGAFRLSANDLLEEIKRVSTLIQKDYLERPLKGKAYLGEKFNRSIIEYMEKLN